VVEVLVWEEPELKGSELALLGQGQVVDGLVVVVLAQE
jgi:hypothetical protein